MKHKIAIALLMSLVLCTSAVSCKVGSVEDPFVRVDPGTLPERQAGKDYAPLERYDETVTIKVIGTNYTAVGGVPSTYHGRPSGPSNNSFNDAALQYLNIKLQYVTTVSGERYEDTLNQLIAAGELPDLFRTSDPTTLEILKRAGLVADLGDTFWYLNDSLREMYLDDIFYDGLESCMEEGKLYAFPNVDNPYERAQKLYLRKDWLDKCGLGVPTTYEEVVSAARAFRDNSATLAALANVPAKEIVPIGITREIATAGNNTAQGFFNLFGTQPNSFFEEDGKLIDANTSDEMKTALGEIKKLYDENLIAREFYNATDSSLTNDIIAGKVGIVSGMWHIASYPLQESVSNPDTPTAEWVAIELPSVNGRASVPIVNRVLIQDYNCVSSKCEHPEAIARLCNLFFEMFYSDDAVQKYGDLAKPSEGFFYSWVPAKLWYTSYSMQSYERVLSVFNDLYNGGFRISDSKLDEMESASFDWEGWYTEMADGQYGEIFKRLWVRERENGFKYGYPYMQAVKAGKSGAQMRTVEKRGYGIYEQAISASGGYAYVTKLARGEKPAVFSEFYGVNTPAQQNYGEYLDSSMKAYFLGVISGSKSLSDWKDFVSDYRKNGGDSVLSQVNDWYGA